MPRAISAALQSQIQGRVQTIAFLVLCTRADGAQLAFSTYDLPLVFNGVTYTPYQSVQGSALKQSADTAVDTMDLLGILGSIMTDGDLRAGRYDNAVVTIYVVNYADLTQGAITLAVGRFGEFVIKDGGWQGEFRAQSNLLKQQIGWQTSPICRVAVFGDNQCKAPVATYTRSSTVTAVTDSKTFTINDTVNPTGWYDNGLFTYSTGSNAGLKRVCKTSTQLGAGAGVAIVMRDAFPFVVAIGDTISTVAGCLRRYQQDCVTKFNNGINFRGEPYLPGNDQIMIVGRGG